MKLLCVGSAYWPAFKLGGPIFSSHTLNKALVRKGVDVTVYCTNAGLEGKVPVNQEVDVDGVKVYYFEYCKLFEFIGPTGWQFSFHLTKALRDNVSNFDVVQIGGVWNYPVAVGAYYCRKYKKPYIITPHGLLFPLSSRGKWWKKYPYFQLVSKRDVQGAAAIHFTTKMEAEQASWAGDLIGRAIVIPNGIDLPGNAVGSSSYTFEYKYPHLKNKKILLFLGRLNWIKGLDLLIKAFSLLSRENIDLHLMITGSDDGDGYTAKVAGWVNNLGLKERVTFTGSLNGVEKATVFSRADIFVLASYSENFANTVAEAMSYAVPVVISNKVGIYRDVQEHEAGIVVDTNVDSICAGIKRLLGDAELARGTGENGKKMVSELYQIDKVADMSIASYSAQIDAAIQV